MNNCLVTKLKAVINNDNLELFDARKIYITLSSGNNSKLGVPGVVAQSVILESIDPDVTFSSVTGDAVLIDSKHVYCPTINYDTNHSGGNIVISNGGSAGDKAFIVRNWHNVKGNGDIAIAASSLTIEDFKDTNVASISSYAINHPERQFAESDISSISGSQTIEYVDIPGMTNIYGDIAALSQCPDLKRIIFKVNRNCICSNIVSLASLTNLSELHLEDLKTAPPAMTIESFVAAARTAGRSTCDAFYVQFKSAYPITFDGAAFSTYPNDSTKTAFKKLSWTATTITLGGTTITA